MPAISLTACYSEPESLNTARLNTRLCAGRQADGSHLPDCFKLQLTDFLPKQLSPTALTKAAQKEAKAKGPGRAGKGGEAKGRAAKAKGRGAGRKRPSNEHK